ncbi:hypothetical protein [Neorickettsia findlayensis]|uniref:Uncharacterized protein n=1 Tax=Neorickettsia findlayensis TaxID=2686014 RepID=A0A6P1G9Q8_9RICK|nr:hypothetical protein [Neorickettsia findlayensis]QHD64934.1 hypothetical protein GP480_00390 [Neorickettsia findlayensis]
MSAVELCEPKCLISILLIAVVSLLSLLVVLAIWIISLRMVKAEIRTLKKRVEDFHERLDLYFAMSTDMSCDQEVSMQYVDGLHQTHWIQSSGDLSNAAYCTADGAERMPTNEHTLVKQLKPEAPLPNVAYCTVDDGEKLAIYQKMVEKWLRYEAPLSNAAYCTADGAEKLSIYENMLIKWLMDEAPLSDAVHYTANAAEKLAIYEHIFVKWLTHKASLSLKNVESQRYDHTVNVSESLKTDSCNNAKPMAGFLKVKYIKDPIFMHFMRSELSCFSMIVPPLSDASESEEQETSVELPSVTESGSLNISRVLLA